MAELLIYECFCGNILGTWSQQNTTLFSCNGCNVSARTSRTCGMQIKKQDVCLLGNWELVILKDQAFGQSAADARKENSVKLEVKAEYEQSARDMVVSLPLHLNPRVKTTLLYPLVIWVYLKILLLLLYFIPSSHHPHPCLALPRP